MTPNTDAWRNQTATDNITARTEKPGNVASYPSGPERNLIKHLLPDILAGTSCLLYRKRNNPPCLLYHKRNNPPPCHGQYLYRTHLGHSPSPPIRNSQAPFFGFLTSRQTNLSLHIRDFSCPIQRRINC